MSKHTLKVRARWPFSDEYGTKKQLPAALLPLCEWEEGEGLETLNKQVKAQL